MQARNRVPKRDESHVDERCEAAATGVALRVPRRTRTSGAVTLDGVDCSMTIGTWLFTKMRGELVGTDAEGNRYFQDKRIMAGRRRKRWVPGERRSVFGLCAWAVCRCGCSALVSSKELAASGDFRLDKARKIVTRMREPKAEA